MRGHCREALRLIKRGAYPRLEKQIIALHDLAS
jgi:hypothetical protein